MVTDFTELPLFPLGTVLFPGGPLPLKIFEARYLDLVARCLREDLEFGVVLIASGNEAGVVQLATVGTSARIVSWDQGTDGLLYVTARGERRFRIHELRQQQDGLNIAQVEWLAEESRQALPAAQRALTQALRLLLAQNEMLYADIEKDYEDASWVGFRLAELLPVNLATRQQCLELMDAERRLQLLAPALEKIRKLASQ